MKALYLPSISTIMLIGLLFPFLKSCDTVCSSVERIFTTPEEEAMIAAAEDICPDFSAILSPEEIPADWMEGECHLWYPGEENSEPLGITKTAIDFYLARAEEMRGDFNGCLAHVNYRAECSFHTQYAAGEDNYENVYVVAMSLDWFYGAGGFEEKRTVVFTSDSAFIALIDSQKMYIMV